VDEDRAAFRFDAAKISMPTLVIRGDADTNAPREDNQQLIDALGSTLKEYVEIPNGGHFMHFENVNLQFYGAVLKFLEAER
jgi:pimeloyl-ACP methyl ester carboxylesterase